MSGAPQPHEAEQRTELPPGLVSLALGGAAALVALGGQVGMTRGFVSRFDLPLTLLLFVLDTVWMARVAQRGAGGMAGLLLAAVAVLAAALGLLLRRDHPWLG